VTHLGRVLGQFTSFQRILRPTEVPDDASCQRFFPTFCLQVPESPFDGSRCAQFTTFIRVASVQWNWLQKRLFFPWKTWRVYKQSNKETTTEPKKPSSFKLKLKNAHGSRRVPIDNDSEGPAVLYLKGPLRRRDCSSPLMEPSQKSSWNFLVNSHPERPPEHNLLSPLFVTLRSEASPSKVRMQTPHMLFEVILVRAVAFAPAVFLLEGSSPSDQFPNDSLGFFHLVPLDPPRPTRSTRP